ncbi:MAG: polyprenyl diphosphate synthase [Bacteroidales bacterium]
MRIPDHLAVIPDGNRRWAKANGLGKEKGYKNGLKPGLKLFKLAKKLGIKEITFYGFTMDNTKRPNNQTRAFTKACIKAVKLLSGEDASLLVVGNTDTKKFPDELKKYTKRKKVGNGGIKVNFLINYGWHWDLNKLHKKQQTPKYKIRKFLKSKDISRVDLIIRWGGRRRLSGFLPVQSIYADIYVVDDYWPDFKEKHVYEALEWYKTQDLTYGG